MIMWFDGQRPLKASQHPVKFAGHRYCDSEDMMYLVVERQDSTCPCLDLPLLFIAFACNAKSCAIAILFCFLLLLPSTDFGRIANFF